MPIHVNHTVQYDTTSRSVFVSASSSDGRPAKGLSTQSSGLRAAFSRSHSRPVEIELIAGELESWRSGGFIEVDAELLPGIYKLDIPDAVMAYGADEALVSVTSDAAVFDPIDITLVAYDPQDARALGLFQLRQRTRHDFLKKALPKMTEMEMALDEGVEYAEAIKQHSDHH